MRFDEILSRFRSLGGIAENLDCRIGDYGRGLFAVNPKREIRLHVPENLLVDPRWVMLDSEEQLRIRPQTSPLSAEAIDFFELYHLHYGWGNGGKDSVAEFQRALQALPKKLKNFLEILGAEDELNQKPTRQYCFEKYFISRQIGTKAGSRLMPIAELINHAHDGLRYVVDGGVSLNGCVAGEIFTAYHRQLDGFHFLLNYQFPTQTDVVLACAVTVEIPGFGTLKINRFDNLADVSGTGKVPKLTRESTHFSLSFVELINAKNPLQPRRTLVDLMATHNMSSAVANDLFDGLVEHHRRVLSQLLQVCSDSSGSMVRDVQSVATSQLKHLL